MSFRWTTLCCMWDQSVTSWCYFLLLSHLLGTLGSLYPLFGGSKRTFTFIISRMTYLFSIALNLEDIISFIRYGGTKDLEGKKNTRHDCLGPVAPPTQIILRIRTLRPLGRECEGRLGRGALISLIWGHFPHVTYDWMARGAARGRKGVYLRRPFSCLHLINATYLYKI